MAKIGRRTGHFPLYEFSTETLSEFVLGNYILYLAANQKLFISKTSTDPKILVFATMILSISQNWKPILRLETKIAS